MSLRDISDLCAALVVQPPQFYKDEFSFTPKSWGIVHVLARHGVCVRVTESGQIDVSVP